MITLDSILYKLTHGVPPLTHAECCWLYTQATGEYVPIRKRCDVCDGEGEVRRDIVNIKPPLLWKHKVACSACGGSGKEREANSQK